MESLVWSARPTLRKGVLVCAFYGWNDGGEAATTSALFLRQQLEATQFCELDPDEFYDFQEVRPIVSLGEDDARRLSWPENSFAYAPLPSGNDIAVMIGIEPQNRWKHYSRSVVEVARESGAELVVTLGGFLADTPHTRPVPVTGSADGELADQLGLAPSAYEGPTGIVGVHPRRLQGSRHRVGEPVGGGPALHLAVARTRRRRSRCSRASRCCWTRTST